MRSHISAVVSAVTPAAAVAVSPAAGPAARTAFLVTGQQVTDGPSGVAVLPGGPGSASQFQELQTDGRTYVLPVQAAAYLNRGLTPALFEPGALARAEPAGRLPVRISYSAGLPALPGVTIASGRDGTATGYLTAAGARVFGAALERQFAGDHADAAYGRDGMFAGRVTITLAGGPAAPRPARPAAPKHTLTVRGITLAGQPDTGGLVTLVDADNVNAISNDVEPFSHGSSPAGAATTSRCSAPPRGAGDPADHRRRRGRRHDRPDHYPRLPGAVTSGICRQQRSTGFRSTTPIPAAGQPSC